MQLCTTRHIKLLNYLLVTKLGYNMCLQGFFYIILPIPSISLLSLTTQGKCALRKVVDQQGKSVNPSVDPLNNALTKR